MNYYPNNLYASYPYNNLYQPNQYSPQQSLSNFNQSSINANNTMNLLGKIVDGEEVVKATEIPLGGFGVFPKADLTEIYIKTWNNNGTTQIIKYQPVVTTATENKQENESSIILEKINSIEAKLDGLVGSALPQQSSTLLKSSTSDKRKELNVNAY